MFSEDISVANCIRPHAHVVAHAVPSGVSINNWLFWEATDEL